MDDYVMKVRALRVGYMPWKRAVEQITEATGGRVKITQIKDGNKIVGLSFNPRTPGGIVHAGEWVVVDHAGFVTAWSDGDFRRRFTGTSELV